MQQREIGGTYTREAEFQREAIKALVRASKKEST